jgi:hypothetical protein
MNDPAGILYVPSLFARLLGGLSQAVLLADTFSSSSTAPTPTLPIAGAARLFSSRGSSDLSSAVILALPLMRRQINEPFVP